MKFTVLPYSTSTKTWRELAGENQCFLLRDNWDDYSYKTSFVLIYFDDKGVRQDVGGVKIMRLGMELGYTKLDETFAGLDQSYSSIGQAQSYYENLVGFHEKARLEILKGLQDAIWDQDIYDTLDNEGAFNNSLMRSLSIGEVRRLRAIIHEEAAPTPFHFKYLFPGDESAEIEISVKPNAVPPTNIHVIIGRNGVGKTRLLRNVSSLLQNGKQRRRGALQFFDGEEDASNEDWFSNLVTVAFSAFDEFDPGLSNKGNKTGIKSTYIGLKKNVKLHRSDTTISRNKTDADLRRDFTASTLTCLRSSRKPRWRSAMRVLENDPGFAALGLQNLIDMADIAEEDFEGLAGSLFNDASSGHKIVLLTMTRLVELVSERTLVLIDEPESHLHPPLAASFIRALSDLLVQRNGVAILATHSPVIVQEVPRTCVSLFFRTGDNVEIERPETETFAENVGQLTREIFRVELTESGYHDLISKAVKGSDTIEDAMDVFDGNLGAEGRALIRALWRER